MLVTIRLVVEVDGGRYLWKGWTKKSFGCLSVNSWLDFRVLGYIVEMPGFLTFVCGSMLEVSS